MPIRKPEIHPLTGKRVTFTPRNSETVISGTALRVDENGAVTIQRSDGSLVVGQINRVKEFVDS